MNRRKKIYSFVLCALVSIAWYECSFRPAKLRQALHSYGSDNPFGENAGVSKYEGLSDPRWKIVHELDKIDHGWEWKMPIDFYGCVVDESEQAVSVANIKFGWTDLSSSGSSIDFTVSDLHGVFSLRGKIGRVLEVDVSKDGYYKPKGERLKSFDYAGFWAANYYEPKPNAPVFFHLRKKSAGEALSSGEIRQAIPADGTPVRLDLLNGGRISAEGQLEVAAVTNTEKYPPRLFDWRATISVPDGGLIEHNTEFPFEAPQGGYVSKMEYNMPASAPNWERVVEKTYFIQFGSPPKYGRIQVHFNGASQKAGISYWMNPSGSRNLEEATKKNDSRR